MNHQLRIIDARGERKICREHRCAYASKCPKCEARFAHAERVLGLMLKTQAAIADGSINQSLIREALYA